MHGWKLAGMAAVGTVAAAGVALGHHGWGEYDATKPITIASPLAEVMPGNPHVTVRLQHEGKPWTAVLAPPSRMSNRGLAPETLKAGTRVELYGYPSKSGAAEMRAERITVAGKTIELR